jgi:hypothetical protein
MKRQFSLLALAAGLMLTASHQAYAHVEYIDVGAGSGTGTFSNVGWFDGTTATLGDSHDLAQGTFFKFHLDSASTVTITFGDTNSTGTLFPAFSLYSGLLPDEGHDDTAVDPLNPKASTFPFAKIASPVDDGLTADAFGRISPFRDTANVEFTGQFDALHSWSMANEGGDWSVIEYLTHVAATSGVNSISLVNFFLQPGDYTLAAAGNNQNCAGGGGCVNTALAGTVSFSATPVPLPAALWMLGSALAGLGVVSRRGHTVRALRGSGSRT